MSDSIYTYYERELWFIRQLAQEFAKNYPAAAGRLLLEPNSSADPHVERLIESFALLSARVQHKLDDEFPELTDALLGVLYPHYISPVPSMAILQFDLDHGRDELPNGFLIDRGNKLHTQAVTNLPCKFRTCYPVTLWPVMVTAANLMTRPLPPGLQAPPGTMAALSLQLECTAGCGFAGLSLDKLRFHLAGDTLAVANLYELLFNNTTSVVFRSLDKDATQKPIVLQPSKSVFPVGFERDEGLLPYPKQSFMGYRLLTEFFAFPGKFLFMDLGGFQQVRRAKMNKKIEVVFFMNATRANVEESIDPQMFRLGCTPIINLFEQTAEPIVLTQERYEYRVTPDVAHPMGMEVHSIESVTSTNPTTGRVTEYQPFYSFRHGGSRETQQAFWYMARRHSLLEGDRGTDVFLRLVDLGFEPRLPSESVVVPRLLCTNRDLPSRLKHFGDRLYFELEAAAPLASINCLRMPTSPLRPPLRKGAHWRLISHLTLNYLSITDPVEGRAALQEILRVYDFSDPESGQQSAAVIRQLIEGITAVSSRRVLARTGDLGPSAFCRGIEIMIEFDRQNYVGTSMFLFACVLERFLGLYASINSFSQLVAKVKQDDGHFRKWPPRAGEQQLL